MTDPTRGPSRPLVSVAIAAHDARPYVGAALASISRQTIRDLEAIVVDDGSSDGTAEEVLRSARDDPRVRLLRLERNRGQGAALNVALDQARGRYLAILDADDEATPDRLAQQIAALQRDRRLVLVGGAVLPWCDRCGARFPAWQYETEDEAIRVRSLFKSEFISGAMTLDLDHLRERGLRFDEGLRVGADWALSLEAMRIGRLANVPETVMRYRLHGGQATAGMVDDLASDGTRIRLGALAWLGLHPSEEELRTHLAVSPCNYWPFGTHPYFEARRDSIADDARAWFHRLLQANVRSRRLPNGPLRAYLDAIASLVDRALAAPPALAQLSDPIAHRRTCASRPSGPGTVTG